MVAKKRREEKFYALTFRAVFVKLELESTGAGYACSNRDVFTSLAVDFHLGFAVFDLQVLYLEVLTF